MAKINEKEKIFDAVRKIPIIADKENWVLTLDRDEGALFYSPKKIPDNTELYQVNDEYALYLDKNYIPRGIMVEYYGYNFVKHHPEFKTLTKGVFRNSEKEREVVIPDKKNSEAFIFKNLLEKTLMTEAMIFPEH